MRATNTKHGQARRGQQTPEYVAWVDMRGRCFNPRNKSFKDYGGRGIGVDARWCESFEAFLADVGPRPSPKHTLERVNNDRGYVPTNVRWATRAEQNANRRFNRMITFNGRTLHLSGWARQLGVSVKTLGGRIRSGWPIERALTAAVDEAKRRWAR